MYYKQGKAMVVFDQFFERLSFKCKVMLMLWILLK
jgi:hypothetical protein